MSPGIVKTGKQRKGDTFCCCGLQESRKGFSVYSFERRRVDGADYAAEAAGNGAVGVVVSDDRAEDVSASLPPGTALIAVEDPLKGLQSLSSGYAGRFRNLVRIGVTGSSGKTTTKEILASILRREAPTISNEGNLNSEIGLPLSLFNVDPSHRFGIFEMGVNFPGEMDILADVFKPEYAVVTNIGTAHIGPLGGINGIVEEKVKIFSFFTENSAAFLPEKGVHLDRMIAACGGRYRLFGEGVQGGTVRAEDAGINGWEIDYMGVNAVFPLPGRHNLDNLYAAVAVGWSFSGEPGRTLYGFEMLKASFPGTKAGSLSGNR